MPTVPGSQVADPFGNRVQGKDQSRLAPGNVLPMFKPSETDVAIAMATMHDMDRLVFNATPMSQDRPFDAPTPEQKVGAMEQGDVEVSSRKRDPDDPALAKDGRWLERHNDESIGEWDRRTKAIQKETVSHMETYSGRIGRGPERWSPNDLMKFKASSEMREFISRARKEHEAGKGWNP